MLLEILIKIQSISGSVHYSNPSVSGRVLVQRKVSHLDRNLSYWTHFVWESLQWWIDKSPTYIGIPLVKGPRCRGIAVLWCIFESCCKLLESSDVEWLGSEAECLNIDLFTDWVFYVFTYRFICLFMCCSCLEEHKSVHAKSFETRTSAARGHRPRSKSGRGRSLHSQRRQTNLHILVWPTTDWQRSWDCCCTRAKSPCTNGRSECVEIFALRFFQFVCS